MSEAEFLQQIQEYEKEQLAYQLDSQRKEFAFDYMFDKQQRGEESESSSDSDEMEESQSEEENDKITEETQNLNIEQETDTARGDNSIGGSNT